MHEDILKLMRQRIRQQWYTIPQHARHEMKADGIDRGDVEHAILTGKIIVRQRDVISNEYKYRILGSTYSGRPMEVVAKLSQKLGVVIITVYTV